MENISKKIKKAFEDTKYKIILMRKFKILNIIKLIYL